MCWHDEEPRSSNQRPTYPEHSPRLSTVNCELLTAPSRLCLGETNSIKRGRSLLPVNVVLDIRVWPPTPALAARFFGAASIALGRRTVGRHCAVSAVLQPAV